MSVLKPLEHSAYPLAPTLATLVAEFSSIDLAEGELRTDADTGGGRWIVIISDDQMRASCALCRELYAQAARIDAPSLAAAGRCQGGGYS